MECYCVIAGEKNFNIIKLECIFVGGIRILDA